LGLRVLLIWRNLVKERDMSVEELGDEVLADLTDFEVSFAAVAVLLLTGLLTTVQNPRFRYVY